MERPWFCYLLSSGNRTYVGATVDLDQRLRRHNGEISGGAKYTRGYQWSRYLHVSGFPSKQDALCFEWRWKKLHKKAGGKTSIERRLKALDMLMGLNRPTTKATEFSKYGPQIIYD